MGAARVLPYVFLSIPAGIIADRYDRRMVLLITDLGRGALMLVLAYLAATDGSTVAIVAVTILATCLSSFFGPTIGAYLPSLVTDESDLGPANTAYASLDNIAFVIGPAAAAVILGISGNLAVAFLLNAVSFVVVAVDPVGPAAVPPERQGRRRRAAGEDGPAPAPSIDWRRIRLPVSGLLFLNAVGGFVFGGMSMLTVVIAYDQLHGGEAATGALSSAEGVGGLIGALVTGVLVLRRRLGPPLVGGALLAGVAVALLGLTDSLAAAMLAMAIAALGSLLVSIVAETLFQRIVPDEARGRALGFMSTVMVLLYAAGALLMPAAVSVVGVGPVLVAAGDRSRGLGRGDGRHPRSLGRAGARAGRHARPPHRALDVRWPAAGSPRDGRAQGRCWCRSSPARWSSARAIRPTASTSSARARWRSPRPRPGPRASPSCAGWAKARDSGRSGCWPSSPRTATVTALTRGTLVALEGADFLDLVNGLGVTSPFVDLQFRQPAPSA